MKILIVEPGKYPYEAEIENTPETKEALVGGTIEFIGLRHENVVLICNENGRFTDLPLNRRIDENTIIVGTFFLCGLGYEELESLTENQMEHFKRRFHSPELFYRNGNEMPVVVRTTPWEYDLLMGVDREFKKRMKNDLDR